MYNWLLYNDLYRNIISSTALIHDELIMIGAYVSNSSRETWKRTYNPAALRSVGTISRFYRRGKFRFIGITRRASPGQKNTRYTS